MAFVLRGPPNGTAVVVRAAHSAPQKLLEYCYGPGSLRLGHFDPWLLLHTSGQSNESNERATRLRRYRTSFSSLVYTDDDIAELLGGHRYDSWINHEPSLLLLLRRTQAMGGGYRFVWAIEDDSLFLGNVGHFLDATARHDEDYLGTILDDHRNLSSWHWGYGTWKPASAAAARTKVEHVERYSRRLLVALEDMLSRGLYAWGEGMVSACLSWRWCTTRELGGYVPWSNGTQLGGFVVPMGPWWNVHLKPKATCHLHRRFASMFVHSLKWARHPSEGAEQELLRRLCAGPSPESQAHTSPCADLQIS